MFLYFRRFFCLIRFGKPAEDNDASALSVLCFPCENHTFPEAKHRFLTRKIVWLRFGRHKNE